MKLSRSTYHALSLETVVVFDLETTGLDPEKDEILEIGVVRVKSSGETERYTQLFRPSVPIPPAITQITGIHPEECQNQPTLESCFQDITGFFKGSEWIVAHNASFDLAFLRKAWSRFSEAEPPSRTRILDTVELSRLLYPWLHNHRLGTVAVHLKAPVSPSHRALADAEATAWIFQECVREILGLDHRVIQDVLRILSGAADGLRLLFEKAAGLMENTPPGKVRKRSGLPVNILGREPETESGDGEVLLEEEKLTAFFKEGGSLSGSLQQFEYRKPQNEMALAVGRAFNQKAFLLAEAGTGVGKSMAYLVPAVQWTQNNRKSKAVVSTHTKTLQDQLFTKELPLLAELFSTPFLAVLLKGRTNYLCIRRWKNLLSHASTTLSPETRRQLLPIVLWASETRTGDIEENSGFHQQRQHFLWSQLHSEAAHCSGSQCAFADSCFYQNVRRAARAAGILVVNHALLFSDVASDFRVLGDYDTLIIDEAHQIERTATQSIGRTLHWWDFRDLCQRLYATSPQEAGILKGMEQHVAAIAGDEGAAGEMSRLLLRLKDGSEKLLEASYQYFQRLGDWTQDRLGGRTAFAKIRLRQCEALRDAAGEAGSELEEALKGLAGDLKDLITLFMDSGLAPSQETTTWWAEMDSVLDQTASLSDLLEYFTRGDYEDDVVWCEASGTGEKRYVTLYTAPLNIGELLRTMLFPRLERCVLTSATLTVGGSFAYIASRLGLDEMENERLDTGYFGSPFDYAAQVRILIPTYLSTPKSGSFTGEVGRLLDRVLSIHARGTMVLFTSHAMLREVYRLIAPPLEARGVRVLAQNLSGSRHQLLQIFREDRQSVLLGTNSFWEGVDVPGDALELLVIPKLPFDVPTEPLVEARTEQVELVSGSGFLNYAVPEAIVRFRQGFGRLIRSGNDRGAVLFLDHRIVHTRYGTLFLQSLPAPALECANEDDLLKKLENWFT
jgi:ATP-dependent DNA helicase DinG